MRRVLIVAVAVISVVFLLNIGLAVYNNVQQSTTSLLHVPHLSNTYQFVRLAKALDVDVGRHRGKTVDWITQGFRPDGTVVVDCGLNSADAEDTLGDIYYAILTLKELGEYPPDGPAIVRHVLSLEQAHGAFTQAPGIDEAYWAGKNFPRAAIENMTLHNTYRALTVLNYLRARPAHADATRQYLLQYWPALQLQSADLTGSKRMDSQDILSLVRSLQLLDVEVERLPDYAVVVEEVNSRIVGVAQQQPLDASSILEGHTLMELSQALSLPLPDFATSFVPQLLAHQHDDGGFDLGLGPYSESLGTRMAVEIIVGSGQSVPERDKLDALIQQHMSPKGGFSLMSHHREP